MAPPAAQKVTSLETADPDEAHFPAQNQTKHCYSKYCEYHRCIRALGEKAAECQKFKKAFHSLCPNEWIAKWDEQLANGTFAGPVR